MSRKIIALNTPISGRFRLRKWVAAPNGEKRMTGHTGWFDNLITDRGMDVIGELARGPSSPLVACQVGSGNSVPQFGDTTLDNRIATSTTVSSSNSIVAGPPRYGRRSIVFTFGQGVAAGNLSEVGISYQTTADGLLYSRALIEDASGNPTVLPVLPTEFLDVEYETRLYIPTGDSNFNILVGDTPTSVTARPASNGIANYWSNYIPRMLTTSTSVFRCTTYTGGLGPENGTPSGQISSANSSFSEYVSGSHYLDYSTFFGINSSNGLVRSCIQNTSMGAYQFEYDPPIDKDNTKEMIIRFRHSWSRYSP